MTNTKHSYRVEIEFKTAKGCPDASFSATVDADSEQAAIAGARHSASALGIRGKVTHASAVLVVEPEPALEVAEAVSLTDEQVAEVKTMAAGLRDGCAVRIAMELVLLNDRLAKLPAQMPHDFGAHGSSRYCKRSGCEARNQPPVNRWGCKGGGAYNDEHKVTIVLSKRGLDAVREALAGAATDPDWSEEDCAVFETVILVLEKHGAEGSL